jgi:hypothetical protein
MSARSLLGILPVLAFLIVVPPVAAQTLQSSGSSQSSCPPRRYPDGNRVIQAMLFGLHPATALFNVGDVIHCDDDEPYPVVEANGHDVDLGEWVRSQILGTGVEPVRRESTPTLSAVRSVSPF